MPNDIKIAGSVEIMAAMLGPNISDLKSFKEDPNAYIFSRCNMDTQHEITVVENTDEVINLSLPYYDAVEKFGARELTEEEQAEIAGGDIILAIFIVFGVVCGVGLAATIGTTGYFIGSESK